MAGACCAPITEPSEQVEANDRYAEQVLARYEARHRSFVKNCGALAVFALGFSAFILVPMIAVKLDAERLPRELAEKEEALRRLAPRRSELQEKRKRLRDELAVLRPELDGLERRHARVQQEAQGADGPPDEGHQEGRERPDPGFRERGVVARALLL